MRNDTTLEALERELQANCGDELAAARACGVSLIFVNQWRKDDKIVDERLAEAARVGVQGLVSEAIRRGVHGTEENVYYKGSIIDTKRVYSDGLLQTLLKAKVEEFKKEGESGVNVQVNVANLMPRAASYEEWLTMKDQTLKPKALPSPDTDREQALEALGRVMCEPPIDAEYEEVKPYAGIEL